jgi:hypothetical protein
MPGVSSVQPTFTKTWHPSAMPCHAMPPGGFRVAIVNCRDLGAGKKARSLLRDHFVD